MRLKSYCLKCEKPNSGCKCNNLDYTIFYSHKVRAPLNTKNKVKFRAFLDDCPIFVNLIPSELEPHFKNLLIKVKYYNKTINGREFTFITKKDRYNFNLYK